MSGLEAPALVVACIAALLAMRQVDQGDEAKRERREDRRSNKEYLDRQMVLHKDSLRIQQEYNSNLVRGLRDIHLRGDVWNNTLNKILIELKAIRPRNVISRLAHPKHHRMLRDSKSARDDSNTAPPQLPLRLLEASPSVSPLALPSLSTALISRNNNGPGQQTLVPVSYYYNDDISFRREVLNFTVGLMKSKGRKYLRKLEQRVGFD